MATADGRPGVSFRLDSSPERLGVPWAPPKGAIRLSLGRTTTSDEIEYVVKRLRKVVLPTAASRRDRTLTTLREDQRVTAVERRTNSNPACLRNARRDERSTEAVCVATLAICCEHCQPVIAGGAQLRWLRSSRRALRSTPDWSRRAVRRQSLFDLRVTCQRFGPAAGRVGKPTLRRRLTTYSISSLVVVPPEAQADGALGGAQGTP